MLSGASTHSTRSSVFEDQQTKTKISIKVADQVLIQSLIAFSFKCQQYERQSPVIQAFLSSIQHNALPLSDFSMLSTNLGIGLEPLCENQGSIMEGDYAALLNCNKCICCVPRHYRLLVAYAKECSSSGGGGEDVDMRECTNCR